MGTFYGALFPPMAMHGIDSAIMQFASHSNLRRSTLFGISLLCSGFVAVLALASPPALANPATTPAKKTGKAALQKGDEAPEPETAPQAPSTPPAGSSPMAALKKSDAALKKLFQKQSPSWSPENDAKKGEMRKIVSSFLDFEELARRSLAKHWDSITPKQRTEFVSVLRELIERNYIRQVHGQANYDLTFSKEVINGSEATVDATLDAVSNSKKVKVEMEYKLLYKGNRWLVYDVVTDEQSMLENYRAEFNKIITKESFDALLKRMKKRLEKAD
jgi:phospholipid transport system substrate-binding protein